LFYASATFVPLALPLAILLSSIMTMGSLGENYELVALKSAGISLTRIMWPLVVISLFLVLSAFYFSNNIFPVANLKMGSLLYDVRQQRPAFNILEGIYYKGIDNFIIKVQEKESDGNTLRNIKIYDHSERRGNTNLTIAEWGTMEFTEDEMFLVFTLYNGNNYQDVKPRDPRDMSRPFQRTYFSKQTRMFDLSAFNLERTDEALFKKNFQMLNVRQLIHFEDSLKNELQSRQDLFFSNVMASLFFYNGMDSLAKTNLGSHDSLNINLMEFHEYGRRQLIITQAMNQIRQIKENSQFSHEEFRHRVRTLARYQIEFHRKFTLSFACLVLFMIGAPLGAIIRKGGFGLPVVISVLFFVVFHVISMMGEKFVREGVLEAWQGMWMSSVLLLPVGVLLIIQSTTDSAVLDTDSYLNRIMKLKDKIPAFLKFPVTSDENSSTNQ
jgi:lipopolysaccharide export system permease protein